MILGSVDQGADLAVRIGEPLARVVRVVQTRAAAVRMELSGERLGADLLPVVSALAEQAALGVALVLAVEARRAADSVPVGLAPAVLRPAAGGAIGVSNRCWILPSSSVLLR